MEDLITPVPIVAVAVPAKLPIFFVAAYDLDQPLKPAEHGREFAVKVKNDLMVGHFGVLSRDHHRSLRRDRLMCHAVRDESGGLKRPEQLVDSTRGVLIGRIDDYAQVLLKCLGDELAGGLEPGFGI